MAFPIKLQVLGLLAIWLWVLAVPSAAEEGDSGPWRWVRPNVELPDYIPAEPGKLSLFADFEHASKGQLPLYVVNRTNREVRMPSLDGDVFLKLERQLPDGTWERAERHVYSECGTYSDTRILTPGTHLLTVRLTPTEGEPATVRYASYGGLGIVSNSAAGLIDPAEVKAARVDGMSMAGFPQGITFWTDTAILYTTGTSEPLSFNGSCSSTVAGLELAGVTGGLPSAHLACEMFEKAWAALPKPRDEQRLALRRVREILKQPWPESPSLARLMDRCLAAVRNTDPKAAAFGRPEKELGLVWGILADCHKSQEFFSRPNALKVELPDPAIWKTVVQLAAERAVKAADQGASQVLEIAPLADEFLADRVFEQLLSSPKENLAKVAAVTLARRGQWKTLVKLAFPLTPENQLQVFRVLTGTLNGGWSGNSEGEIRSQPADSLEQVFWDRVQRRQPLQVSVLLGSGWGKRNEYSRGAFNELFAYWHRELERSRKAPADFALTEAERDSRFLVRFIGTWEHPDDFPLLRASLDYRGYTEETSTVRDPGGKESKQVKHVYDVRREAAEALKRCGEQIPADLVLEVDVTPKSKGQ